MKEPLAPAALISAIFTTSLKGQVHLELSSLEDLCQNLIVFDSKSNVVRFAHRSVQEFIRMHVEFEPARAQSRLATSCLGICIEGPSSENDSDFAPIERIYHYAALYWPDHYKCAGDIGSNDELLGQISEFIFEVDQDPTLSFMSWMDSLRLSSTLLSRDHPKKKAVDAVISVDFSPLFTACVHGFHGLLDQVGATKGFDWDQKNDLGHTGLYLASATGQTPTAHLLIQRGANVNIQCGRLGSPLYAACFAGHLSVVRLLLDSHADPRLGGTFENAVEAAFRGDHEDVAMSVLQTGFEFLNQEEYERTMLGASRVGFIKVVEYMQEPPRNPTLGKPAPEKIQAMANKAITGGRQELLQYFLRRETSSLDVLPGDAVASAALYGRQAMVEFLLEYGLNIEKEGLFGSPLRSASLMNQESVVRTLLDRGANANACGKLGTALQAAAMKGHIRITKLLIEEGADVNLSGGFYGTALQAAAYHGHKEALKILLEAGANVYFGGLSKDAFHAAAEGGHYQIVELLLQRGYHSVLIADALYAGSPPSKYKALLRSPDRDGCLDLHRGSRGSISRYASTASLQANLLDYGEIFEAMDQGKLVGSNSPIHPYRRSRNFGSQNYALEAAASAGKILVAQLILERRKDLSVSDKEIGWAFQTAAEHGHLAVVRLLLEGNLDLGPYVQKSLEIAASKGHEDILVTIWDYAAAHRSVKVTLLSIIKLACRGQASMVKLAHDIVRRRCSEDESRNLLRALLVDAAEHGNLKSLGYFLQHGMLSDQEAMTMAFKAACESGDTSTVVTLLDQDINHFFGSEEKGAGLKTAATHGHYELVLFFLDHFRENCSSSMVEELVMHAAGNGHTRITKLLTKKMETGDKLDYTLTRALTIAAENGHEEVVSFLVRKIPDVNTTVQEVPSPTTTSVSWGRPSIRSLGRLDGETSPEGDYISKDCRSSQNTSSPSAQPKINAFQACLRTFSLRQQYFWGFHDWKNGTAWEAIIRVLLDHGLDVNALENQANSPLHEAVKHCSEKVVSWLIEAGANPNASAGDKSVLEVAAERELSAYSVLQRLLHAGAIIPRSDSCGNPLLDRALAFFVGETSRKWYTCGDPDGRFLLSNSIQYVLDEGPGAVIHALLLHLPEERATDVRYRLLLQMAATAGNRSYAELLVDRGVDVNSAGYYYGTALQAACRRGHTDLVRFLLQAGADVNVLQGRHQTALRAAVVGGHTDIVETLVKHGASVSLCFETEQLYANDRERRSPTALHLAVARGFNEVAKKLLASGADVHADLPDHPPMLISACKDGNIELVELLLDAGANVNASGEKKTLDYCRGSSVTSPLHVACAKGRESIVCCLLARGADVNKVIEHLGTPLTVAAQKKNLQILRLLLAGGAEVDQNSYSTALSTASYHGWYEIVKELLSSGATMYNPASIPNALTKACQAQHFSMTELLLEKALQTGDIWHVCAKALKTIYDRRNIKLFELLLEYLPITTEALIWACSVGSEYSVELILDRGIEVDSEDTRGLCAINAAAYHLHLSIVRLLVGRGANVRHRSKLFGTPIWAALEGCIVPLWRQELWKPHSAMFDNAAAAASSTSTVTTFELRTKPQYKDRIRCEQVVQFLIDNGAQAETDFEELGNDLHLASWMGSEEIARLLLDGGVDINASSKYFEPAVFAALAHDHSNILELLLKRSIDVNRASEKHGTPLHYACSYASKEAVRMLLRYGADPNSTGLKQETPLTAALTRLKRRMSSSNDKSCFDVLLQNGDGLIICESDLLAAAQMSQKTYLQRLLEHDESMTVSEDVIVAALKNHCFSDEDTLNLLLERSGGIGATKEILKSAETPKMMKTLLGLRPICRITEEILEALHEWELMELLLLHDPSFTPPASTVVAYLKTNRWDRMSRSNQENPLDMLWDRNPALHVTEDMLKAAENPNDLHYLLERTDPAMRTSQGVLEAVVAKLSNTANMLQLLLQRDKNIRVPTKTALQLMRGSNPNQMLNILLEHDPNTVMTEDIFLIAFGGTSRRKAAQEELIELLKKYDVKLHFTTKIREEIDSTFQARSDAALRESFYCFEE